MKRLTQIIAVLLVAVLLVVLVNLQKEYSDKEKSYEKYSVVYTDVFDTVTQLVGYAESQADFDRMAEKLHSFLLEYHQYYDIYHSYDGIVNIKDINDSPVNVPIKVDAPIMDLLALGKKVEQLTNGKNDITYGNVLSIWHDYREEGIEDEENARIPSMEELEEARKHCGWDLVELDEKNLTVTVLDDKMSFDVGSIGKGYAAQKVAEYAKEIGMNDFLFSVGGNVVASGEKENQKSWNVGIQNPDGNEDGDYLFAVKVKDDALVTSGDYQRYYTVEEKRYCHIIDIEKLMPSSNFRSVSVRTGDSAIADALSTGLFCMTLEEGQKLIESLEDTEAVWVLPSGEIIYSSMFERYIVK